MAEVNGMRIAVLKRTATARVTGIVRGFQYQSEFTIPTQVEEKGMTFRVTEIDDAAFRNCSALTSITIPEGIVRIGKLAFAECSRLTSITIPKTVTQIDCGGMDIGDKYYLGHLFSHCPCLTSIVVEEGNPRYKSIQNGNGIIDKKTNTLIAGDQTTIIPDSVTSIGEFAFHDCDALTSITIPNSVTSIGYRAFYDCDALTSITIPNSVTSIGWGAFKDCDALTSITIPDSVTSIGDYAFYNCDALTSVTIENEEGKVAIGENAFPSKAKITYVGKPKELLFIVSKDAATAKITGVGERFKNQSKFVIPTQVEEDGKTFRVTEIADAAFSNSSALTSITISEGVVRIGKLAFANCPRLTSITIPKTVTQIESGRVDIGENVYRGHLFTNCPSLTSIVVEEGNPRYKSIQSGNGIIDKTTNTLIAGDQTISIPEDVINIGEYAFAECKALTSITIPNSVKSIGNWAFAFCPSLSSVNIPNNVTSIGESAFRNCDALTSVTIGNSVTNIEEDTFYYCKNLSSITIENEERNISIDKNAFPSSAKIKYVIKFKDLYFADSFWYSIAKIVGVVEKFKNQSEFTIPTQVEKNGKTFRVTEIDDAAFRNCSALTSITIPEGIVRIGRLAFAECSNLTSITIPKTVTQIDCDGGKIGDNFYLGHLFTHCPCLTSIVVEEGNPRYKSIQNGNGIIDKKTNTLIAGDQTTIIPNSVTSIGDHAFDGCDALTSITIPNSVTSIGWGAFYDCDALTSITIPDSVTSIGGMAFSGCSSLTSVTIDSKKGKVAIGEDAFPSNAKINYPTLLTKLLKLLKYFNKNS